MPASVVDKRDFPVMREEAENSFRAVLMHKIAMNSSDRQALLGGGRAFHSDLHATD